MSFIRPLAEITKAHYEWATTGSQGRIALGFDFFDQATSGGVALGEVCMFLARSNVGKSWWACNVAVNNRHTPTVFFSLEMQDRFMFQRIVAVHQRVTTKSIEEEIRATGASQAMETTVQDFPLLEIVDTPEMSLKQMSQALREYEEHHGHGVELVIVDYLELIKAGMALGSLEQVDNVSRAIKNWARSEDVAFIVLHQTNMNPAARVGSHGEIDAGHLPLTRGAARFGGDVAADYTVAAFKPSLKPDMDDTTRMMRQNEFHLQLLKNRGGNTLYEGGVQHHVDIDTWRIT